MLPSERINVGGYQEVTELRAGMEFGTVLAVVLGGSIGSRPDAPESFENQTNQPGAALD